MRKMLLFTVLLGIVVIGLGWLDRSGFVEEMDLGQNGSRFETRQQKKVHFAEDDLLVLVNRKYVLTENDIPKDLDAANVSFLPASDSEERLLRTEAARALERMFKAAEREGIVLLTHSGYRSYHRQQALYETYVRTRGQSEANLYCDEPGTSEHQTGLAIDIGHAHNGGTIDDTNTATAEGEWVEAHAAEYGFIIRYMKDKEDVTGHVYEPWHLRYVGSDTARSIVKSGVSLEEYLLVEPPA